MNAVARLVANRLRGRGVWFAFGLYALQAGNFLGGSSPLAESSIFRTVLGLGGPMFIGGLADSLLRVREILQLPISRVTLWRAEWWLTVALPALGSGVAIAIGVALHGTFSADTALLPALYGFAGVALFRWLRTVTSVGRYMDAPVDPRDLPRVLGIGTIAFVLFLGLLVAIAYRLPAHIGDLNMFWAAGLIGCAGLGISAYFYQPPIAARPSMRAPSRPASNNMAARQEPREATSALTGWRMALWHETRRRFLTFAILLALVLLAAIVAGIFRPLPPLREILSSMGLLPFASHRAQATEAIIWGALLMFSAMTEPIRGIDWRALRSQPIGGRTLAVLPLISGILSATMLFVSLGILHVIVLAGTPVALRSDLFVAVAAFVAFAEVTRLFVTAPVSRAMARFAPIGALWLLLGYHETYRRDIVQPATLIIGLLVLIASVPIARAMFTRSPRLYRARPLGRIGA